MRWVRQDPLTEDCCGQCCAAMLLGMSKRDIVPNLNFFMNVPIDPAGNFTVVDGVSKPGDAIELVAEMDVLCLISNCPQINNPCNGFFPTPVQVTIYVPQEG